MASGSPASIKVGSKTYKYGPLSFKKRGELERVYFAVARNPVERITEILGDIHPDDREFWEQQLVEVRRSSQGWKPNVEEPAAEALFLDNDGGDPDEDYRSKFLAIAFDAKPEEVDEIAGTLTKGQLKQVWDLCLEVGPHAPK